MADFLFQDKTLHQLCVIYRATEKQNTTISM